MSNLKRDCYCGDLRASDVGKEISVCGWVQRRRDLGHLIFVDLRDRSGILQLAFDDDTDRDVFESALTLRGEYVIYAQGKLRERSSKNPDIPTGDVELEVRELKIFAKSETPPFEIVENSDVNDALRLKYRYLDLRRPDMQNNIALRHKALRVVRQYFDENGFYEIETPILTKSTPEGARDYLVPSRVHQGKFYALPQSPQQYKQLLMLAGFDRYMQIARCFRDEDLRADRQPEFTQIDLEMSFVDVEDIIEINEGFLKRLFFEVIGLEVQTPMQRLTWREAMDRYGSDKPDLRFELELCDISDIVANCEFRVFSDTISAGGSVRMIYIPNGGDLPRKQIDALGEFVKTYGAKGLAWTKYGEDGENTSSFSRFLSDEENEAISQRAGAEPGGLLCIIADAKDDTVFAALGALRCECARQLGLIKEDEYRFLWITEFPLFEYDEDENRYVARHHPFTSAMDEDMDLIENDKGACRAKAYDIVLNGTELGGGSIRINTPEMQMRMFNALGFTNEQAQEQFGHLLEAFKYGAPPHGGLAYGLDRLVMHLAGLSSIRDVIAFPKVQNASELMTSTPDVVSDSQLSELGIELTVPQ
ncbi:MAG: aspartate--tRNA ligase [Oscillospiraceae bacterium]|nr:aspartate--tRNA ligase [Oscillospiraceae bacterium]